MNNRLGQGPRLARERCAADRCTARPRRRVHRSHRDDIDDPVRRLVKASEVERQRLTAAAEAQRKRRRNAVAAVISVLPVAVLGMIGVSFYAFDQRAEAVSASLDASRARDDATAERDRG